MVFILWIHTHAHTHTHKIVTPYFYKLVGWRFKSFPFYNFPRFRTTCDIRLIRQANGGESQELTNSRLLNSRST